MRIKKVKCDQFAGIQRREIEFDKGMNIVLGDNESGKSTLVDLMYHMLFRSVNLGKKTKNDIDFSDRYFPKEEEGPQGDVIDGSIVIEGENDTYILEKEWESGAGNCKLTPLDGPTIKNEAAIKEILLKELKAEAGVYSEIVFASQKRNHNIVESVMKALSKSDNDVEETKRELKAMLTQAALETGGVSLDKIEEMINGKLEELSMRWDFEANMPEDGVKRGINNQWRLSKDNAGILKAYYEVEEVRKDQKNAEEAELEVEKEKAAIQELKKEKKAVEDNREEFQKYRGLLISAKNVSQIEGRLLSDIKAARTACEEWPKDKENKEKAEKLRKEQAQTGIRDLYLKAKDAKENYDSELRQLEVMMVVDQEDIESLRELKHSLLVENSRLSGMNLTAQVRELGDVPVGFKNISTGKELEKNDGLYHITEATEINIPGVLEMQLIPMGINVSEVKASIDSITKEIDALYDKYNADSLDVLENKCKEYSDKKGTVDRSKEAFENILLGRSWEDIQNENAAVPDDIESISEIQERIAALCGDKTVDEYIGGLKERLNEYENKYTGMEELADRLEELKRQLGNCQNELAAMDDIPEEYKDIEDANAFDEELRLEIDDLKQKIEKHEEILRNTERNLGERSAEEYSEERLEKTNY